MKTERDRLVEQDSASSLSHVLHYYHDIIEEPEQTRRPFSILEILLRGQWDIDHIGIFFLSLFKLVFVTVICFYHHGRGICQNDKNLLIMVVFPMIGTFLGLKISQRLMVKTLRRDLVGVWKYWTLITLDLLFNAIVPLVSTSVVIQDQHTLLDVAINFAVFMLLIDVDGIILRATRRSFRLYSDTERAEYERVLLEGTEKMKSNNPVIVLMRANHLAEAYTMTISCVVSVLFLSCYTLAHCSTAAN